MLLPRCYGACKATVNLDRENCHAERETHSLNVRARDKRAYVVQQHINGWEKARYRARPRVYHGRVHCKDVDGVVWIGNCMANGR